MRSAVALLFAAPLLAAPVPKELKKPDDATALLGTWVAKEPDTVRFRFEADGKMTTWHQKGDGAPYSEMKWTWNVVDVKATPRRARMNRAENPSAGYDCVYEWTAEGLTFALVLNNGTAIPDKLEPLSGLEFHRFTRDKGGK